MMVEISGATKLAGVIGWPLEHTLSPVMHNAAYSEMGVDWVYVPLAVSDERDLARVLSAIKVLPFVGFNVTMPYKQAMVALCDEVAALALLAGAVNTVQCVDGRLVGFNTDGRGLIEALASEAAFEPQGSSVTILGAGGAAGGALVALALEKARRITVVNRNSSRAKQLVQRVNERLPDADLSVCAFDESARDAVFHADLVVNATSLGMKPEDPSPVPSSWLRSGQLVADMVYRAEPTALVLEAREAGATAMDGLMMLVCQGATAIDIWRGDAESRAPRDAMREAAERALGRKSPA
jgi:shikimate dehydrogenase